MSKLSKGGKVGVRGQRPFAGMRKVKPHKIAKVVFHMLSRGEEYRPLGATEYERQFKERQIRFLERKVAKLGLQVTPI